MKKLFLIFVICLCVSPAFAVKMQYGVIAKEAFKDVQPEINTTPYKLYVTNAPEGYRKDYSDGSYSVSVGTKGFSYKNNKLELILISDKSALEFPRKTMNYDYPSGKLLYVAYATSLKDAYIFNPDGSLYGIWEDDVFFKGDKQTLSAKTSLLD